ncbi:hypothetical protein F444_04311 [Phytophthora nicotianae P1976]|uniref:Uncharacterized protein n=1 Tax=Phytophthora nicotianae P1976 TaxID=1317066 RepID=A0A081AR55_PHYNI|nr:hypothetical protein F444_04311 [Phytophthora nicotianae P1976]
MACPYRWHYSGRGLRTGRLLELQEAERCGGRAGKRGPVGGAHILDATVWRYGIQVTSLDDLGGRIVLQHRGKHWRLGQWHTALEIVDYMHQAVDIMQSSLNIYENAIVSCGQEMDESLKEATVTRVLLDGVKQVLDIHHILAEIQTHWPEIPLEVFNAALRHSDQAALFDDMAAVYSKKRQYRPHRCLGKKSVIDCEPLHVLGSNKHAGLQRELGLNLSIRWLYDAVVEDVNKLLRPLTNSRVRASSPPFGVVAKADCLVEYDDSREPPP